MTDTTPALVAEQATLAGVLPLDGLTVIGIYNTLGGYSALLRSARGQFARVTAGTQSLGVSVAAISDTTVMVVDGAGTSYALAVPGS